MKSIFSETMLLEQLIELLGWGRVGEGMWIKDPFLNDQCGIRITEHKRFTNDEVIKIEKETIEEIQNVFAALACDYKCKCQSDDDKNQLQDKDDINPDDSIVYKYGIDKAESEEDKNVGCIFNIEESIEEIKKRIIVLETASKAWRDLNLRVRALEVIISRKANEIAKILRRPVPNGEENKLSIDQEEKFAYFGDEDMYGTMRRTSSRNYEIIDIKTVGGAIGGEAFIISAGDSHSSDWRIKRCECGKLLGTTQGNIKCSDLIICVCPNCKNINKFEGYTGSSDYIKTHTHNEVFRDEKTKSK